LREVRVELGGGEAVEELEQRLRKSAGADALQQAAGDGLSVRDPDGQLLTFGKR
jgi:hypothetical protein